MGGLTPHAKCKQNFMEGSRNMEGQITDDGRLLICRPRGTRNVEISMGCYFSHLRQGQREQSLPCADICPHFGNPVEVDETHAILRICQGRILKFKRLYDQRTGKIYGGGERGN